MNAIQLLKRDHRAVEALFGRFEKLGSGKSKEKKAIVQDLTRELSIHAAIEEEILYPAARAVAKDKEDLVLESLEEHHLVKVVLEELQSLSPTSERYDAKVRVLKEAIERHVAEEETDLFPALQRKLDRGTLEQLGGVLESAKKIAPTRPHPRTPDQPPANVLANVPAAMLDRIRDLLSGTRSKSGAAIAESRGRRSMGAGGMMNRIGRAAGGFSRRSARRRGARSDARGGSAGSARLAEPARGDGGERGLARGPTHPRAPRARGRR